MCCCLLLPVRYVTVFAAAVTGWLIPFRIAYMSVSYDNAHVQGATMLEVRCSGIRALRNLGEG
jgi:hypothetical protein